jgi:hypothetical protein
VIFPPVQVFHTFLAIGERQRHAERIRAQSVFQLTDGNSGEMRLFALLVMITLILTLTATAANYERGVSMALTPG